MHLDGAVARLPASVKEIGRVIALPLAQQGVRVVMHDHDHQTHASTTRDLLISPMPRLPAAGWH